MENKLFMGGMTSILLSQIFLLIRVFYSDLDRFYIPVMLILLLCGFILIIVSHFFSKKVIAAQSDKAFRTYRNMDAEKIKSCLHLHQLPEKERIYKLFYSRDNSQRVIFFSIRDDEDSVWVARQKLVLYSWNSISETASLGDWKTLSPPVDYKNIEQALQENKDVRENYREETLSEIEKSNKRRIFILRKKRIPGCAQAVHIWVDGLHGKLKNGRGVVLETDCFLHVLKAGDSIMMIGSSEEDCIILIEPLPLLQFREMFNVIRPQPCKFEEITRFGVRTPIESSEYIFGI